MRLSKKEEKKKLVEKLLEERKYLRIIDIILALGICEKYARILLKEVCSEKNCLYDRGRCVCIEVATKPAS